MEAVTHPVLPAAPMASQRAALAHSDCTFKKALNFLISSLLIKFNGRAVGLLLSLKILSVMFEELKYFKQLLSAGSPGPFGLANPSLAVKGKNSPEAMRSPGLKSSKSQSLFPCLGAGTHQSG